MGVAQRLYLVGIYVTAHIATNAEDTEIPFAYQAADSHMVNAEMLGCLATAGDLAHERREGYRHGYSSHGVSSHGGD